MTTRAERVTGCVLLVALAIWAGAKLYSTHESLHADLARHGDLQTAAPVEEAAEEMLPPPRIPDRLPQFSLNDRAGKSTAIASFAGKSLIINFWATWCAPCRSEIPLLKTLNSEWAGRGLTVVGIAVDRPDNVQEFADRFKIGYPLLIGEQDALDAAAAFGVESPVFPFTVFTDSGGDVVALFIGQLHRPQADLILAEVQSLNEGRVQLPAARQAITEGLRALHN
jgi:thiol-disulfide isomerase/thioredoxin